MGRKRTGRVERKGDRYQARLGKEYLGTEDTPEQARELIAAALIEDKQRDQNSFAERGQKYMEREEMLHRERRGNVSMFDKEWSLWNRHIRLAKFFHMPILNIRREHVQTFLDSIVGSEALQIRPQPGGVVKKVPSGKRIGARTAKRVRSRLTHFFDTCLELQGNPAARCRIANVRSNRKRVDGDRKPHLHTDEIERLFALPELTAEHRAVYACGIYAGLRVDEIWGLRWENLARLDGDEPEIHVRWSFNSPTKTENSEREVPMLPQLVAALKAYRASLPTAPIRGVVFPGDGGKVRAHGSRARWEDKRYRNENGDWRVRIGYRTMAGIREHIQFRHLRHSCATHLLAGTWTHGHEWPIEKVSELLGHDSVETTKRYYVDRQAKRLHSEVAKGQEIANSKRSGPAKV